MQLLKPTSILALFEKKPFAKLPCVKYLSSKCNQIDGENYYQHVILSNFEASFHSLSHKKKKFLDAVKCSIKDWLSEETESNKIFESFLQILNTEGWERGKIGCNGNTIRGFEFADAHVEYLYEHLNILLAAAGVKVSSVNLLSQWHELPQYFKEFLSTGVADYTKIW